MMTGGDAGPGTMQDAVLFGAQGVLAKPLDSRELRLALAGGP